MLTAMSRSEKVQHSIVGALCNLTEGLSLKANESCQLARDPFPLLNKLTTCAFSSKVSDIIFGSFMAATGILQSSTDRFLATNYIEHLINKYREFEGADDVSRSMRGGLLAALHSSVLVLREKCDNDTDLTMDKVFAFICYHFDLHREVDADGLYVISALAVSYEKRFGKHLDRSWGYIVHAFAKVFGN